MVDMVTPIGSFGVLPDRDNNNALETTVLSVGSTNTAWGTFVGILHALIWGIACILILFWGNDELRDVTYVTESAKTLGNFYGFTIIAILVSVVLHAMFAKKEEMFQSTMASVFLLWLVFIELSFGCAYLAYSMSHASFYGPAVTCHILVCGGCAMIVVFYVNFTHNGNLTTYAKTTSAP